MSVFRNRREWNRWNEMVSESKSAEEDFNDMPCDNAILQADKKIQSLLSKNYSLEKENAELKETYKKLELAYANSLENECGGTIEEALEFIRGEQGE